MNEYKLAGNIYKKLLDLYPAAFKAQFGEPMWLTFQDLLHEKQQMHKNAFGFVFWLFIETSFGIFQEHLAVFIEGGLMQAMLKTMGLAGAISFILTVPLAAMEMVNRKEFNEVFPFPLFFALWFNIFAIGMIAVPILQGVWWRQREAAYQSSAQITRSPAEVKPILHISMVLLVSIFLFVMLDLLTPGSGKVSAFGMQVPGQFAALLLIGMTVVVGIMAGSPIVRTLHAGGGLFAHPVHLIVVVGILVVLILGPANLIIDQWPCFMGLPNCD